MKNDQTQIDVKAHYKTVFNGKFFGILRWHQLDNVWESVLARKQDGWYIYNTNSSVPKDKINTDQLENEIESIDKRLRTQHDEDYCGVVYVDNLEKPALIKVFDPKNMGTSCSVGGKAPLPEWIISMIPPADLTEEEKPRKYKKRWLGNLFSK